ncbi:pectinesterase, active site-containing protein [Tanacetum coccineum]
MAKSMTFRNTAGPEGEQAVALKVQSEGAVVYRCRIEGYQDTLLYQNYRLFYRDYVITGTVDFIFVADGNEKSYMIGGLVLHNCTVEMDNDLEMDVDKGRYEIYLGRPWMPAAKMAVIESDLGGFLNPEGLENRVKWSSLSILKDNVQAQPYTVASFIDGEPWLQ